MIEKICDIWFRINILLYFIFITYKDCIKSYRILIVFSFVYGFSSLYLELIEHRSCFLVFSALYKLNSLESLKFVLTIWDLTDKFYPHFPSYIGEKLRNKLLEKYRQVSWFSRWSSADNASKQVRTEKYEQYVAQNRPVGVLPKQNSNEMSNRDVTLWNENRDLSGVFRKRLSNIEIVVLNWWYDEIY